MSKADENFLARVSPPMPLDAFCAILDALAKLSEKRGKRAVCRGENGSLVIYEIDKEPE